MAGQVMCPDCGPRDILKVTPFGDICSGCAANLFGYRINPATGNIWCDCGDDCDE